MQITQQGGIVNVTLSRRNLEHLLGALDKLPAEGPYLQRLCEDGTFLIVTPEENDVHYERVERVETGTNMAGPGFEGIV